MIENHNTMKSWEKAQTKNIKYAFEDLEVSKIQEVAKNTQRMIPKEKLIVKQHNVESATG